MNVSAWAQQRARYSRARRGRNERGASLAECAAVEATATVMALAANRDVRPAPVAVPQAAA